MVSRKLNTHIIQKIISKDSPFCECMQISTVEYISLQALLFFLFFILILNVFKFELQYERTLPKIFFC